MLPFIPLHFLCTHFWQLVHCNELLTTPLLQTPHGHLTAFCLTFWRSPLIITLVLFILTLMPSLSTLSFHSLSLYINFLKSSLLSECCRLYPDNDFVFMQDSAPSHRTKATQNFLRDNTPDFISSQEWRPHLPDLNSLDYSVWDILQELVYEGKREPFANLKDLQNIIRDKWHDVDDQTVRKAILQWKRHLAAVAQQNGGPIQHIFCWSVDWYELLWRSGVACVQPTT